MCRIHLIGLAWAALLLSGARAGEVKSHAWPCKTVKGSVCDVPVFLDKELEARCSISAGTVTLKPVGIGVLEGCSNVSVVCSSNLTLTCSIVPTGVVAGNYSASLSKNDVDAPGGAVKLCVKLTDAVPGGKAGRSSVLVARVQLTISPRP